MKKLFSLIAIATMVFAVNGQAFVDGGGNSPNLQVTKVTVTNAVSFADNLKKDTPQPMAAAVDFLMDGYTAPAWATGVPSVFSIEEYSFTGGSLATVGHRVIYNNNLTPAPTIAILFAWQPCGSTAIYPPMPGMAGACPAGIALSLPSGGIWYITVGVSGFTAGTSWDWVWQASQGVSCISVPGGALGADTFGGEVAFPTLRMDDGSDSGSRPWCFSVI